MSDPRERYQPIASHVFLLLACLLFCGIARAAPSISLSKKSGPPTSKILVSGRGFEPNVGVDIYFDTKDEALVVTNHQGEFDNAGIHAPRSAYPGKHWVTALERNNDKGAQQPFLVQTDWRQFHFDADGTRLNPYENVLSVSNAERLGLKWASSGGGGLSSPAVANGVVYVGSDDGNIYALNTRSGSKLWSYHTGSHVQSSPAFANGVVYFGSADDTVYALSASTGAKLWSYTTENQVVSSPAVSNGIVYVTSTDNNVYALNAGTGAVLWSYTTGSQVVSSPAVVNGVVYFNSNDNNVYALNAHTGAKLWSHAGGGPSSPAVANGVVYFGSVDDNVYALNANSGAELWSYTTGNYSVSSPAVANGVVYVGSDDGNLYALNASTGTLLWRYPTTYEIESSPAVANGVVYVNSDNLNLYALDAETGALLWTYPSGAGYSSPTIADGVVYIDSFENSAIYAFSLQLGDRPRKAPVAKRTERPSPRALRPDFNLKVSKSVAITSGAEL